MRKQPGAVSPLLPFTRISTGGRAGGGGGSKPNSHAFGETISQPVSLSAVASNWSPRWALLSACSTVKCPKQSFLKQNKPFEAEVTPDVISEAVHLKVCYQLFVPGSTSDFSFRCDGSRKLDRYWLHLKQDFLFLSSRASGVLYPGRSQGEAPLPLPGVAT